MIHSMKKREERSADRSVLPLGTMAARKNEDKLKRRK
jgi:hypothetical protein